MIHPILFTALLLTLSKSGFSFVPMKVINDAIELAAKPTKLDFGMVSDSISHDTIIQNGVVRSVALYFYEQKGGSQKVKLTDMNRYFNDIEQLYKDYYGASSSNSLSAYFIAAIAVDLRPSVASVDLDKETKDLPYAHFDAEKFKESNQRVIDLNSQINASISKADYSNARKLSGKVLHTIHDFYSHSNWIESGNEKINTAIGSEDFNKQLTASSTDPNTCESSNCQLVTVQCSEPLTALSHAIKKLKPDFSLGCPVKYYKCSGNLVMLDKLVSGYYTNQKLTDGTVVANPGDLNKCNHGGILDSNSYSKQALGGINKDSGMYLLSPHADLHQKAALLAELHTEYFFNSIRKSIGDEKFAKFLSL